MRRRSAAVSVMLILGMILLFSVKDSTQVDNLYYRSCSYLREILFKDYNGGEFSVGSVPFNFEDGVIIKGPRTLNGDDNYLTLYPSIYQQNQEVHSYCGRKIDGRFRIFISKSKINADGVSYEQFIKSYYMKINNKHINKYELELYEARISQTSVMRYAIGSIDGARFFFQGISENGFRPTIRVIGRWNNAFEVRFHLRAEDLHAHGDDPYHIANWKTISLKIHSMIKKAHCNNNESEDCKHG